MLFTNKVQCFVYKHLENTTFFCIVNSKCLPILKSSFPSQSITANHFLSKLQKVNLSEELHDQEIQLWQGLPHQSVQEEKEKRKGKYLKNLQVQLLATADHLVQGTAPKWYTTACSTEQGLWVLLVTSDTVNRKHFPVPRPQMEVTEGPPRPLPIIHWGTCTPRSLNLDLPLYFLSKT